MWEPSPRPLSSLGEVQGAKAPASSLHSKEATPEPPASAPEKVKVAVATLTSADGWVSIWVLGAVVSTDQLKEAGRGIGVAGVVDRPHFEAVGAVAEPAQFPRRGARREGAGVEPAFEGGDAGAAGVRCPRR